MNGGMKPDQDIHCETTMKLVITKQLLKKGEMC